MIHGWLRGGLLAALLLILAVPVQAGQVTVFAAASTTDAVQAIVGSPVIKRCPQ